MASIDIPSLVKDLQNTASAVIGKDVTALRGFSKDQLQAIAQQSALIAAGIADGSISPSLRDYFLDSLEEMVKSFVNTLAGMVVAMIEEVWNAMVGVIWKAINAATGLSLVVP